MNIVFFDIDGTLAQGVKVPESAQEALKTLRTNGNLVFICTGRPIAYVKMNFSQYADGFIVSNGRQGFYGDTKIFDKPLTGGEAKEYAQILDAVGAGYIFFDEKGGYYYGPDWGYEALANIWPERFVQRNVPLDSQQVYNFDVLFNSNEMQEHVTEALQGKAILNLHTPHPSADITLPGWTKGDGVKAVALYLHVPLENTYAFGDGANDFFMLEAAGHGIAMGNAVDALKEKADYITADIDKDGVYLGLKHFGLI